MPPAAWQQVEAEVLAGCKSYLELRGWRPVRNQVGMMAYGLNQRLPFGEKGMPDYTFIRYIQTDSGEPHPLGLSYLIWVEFKRPAFKEVCSCGFNQKGKFKKCTFCCQREWKEAEKARGALVIRVSGVPAFVSWYENRFGFLHTGMKAIGQLELLVEVIGDAPVPVLDVPTLELPRPKGRWDVEL